MNREGKIVWRAGEHGYETRAILVDGNGAVLHEGRIIPYTLSGRDDASDARIASARDVTDWAMANGVTVLANDWHPMAQPGATASPSAENAAKSPTNAGDGPPHD
jgi:hypothetical protein